MRAKDEELAGLLARAEQLYSEISEAELYLRACK